MSHKMDARLIWVKLANVATASDIHLYTLEQSSAIGNYRVFTFFQDINVSSL